MNIIFPHGRVMICYDDAATYLAADLYIILSCAPALFFATFAAAYAANATVCADKPQRRIALLAWRHE